ncbi:hypothetical protein DOX69_22005 [Cronobacter sakazakii]|nr:hypothetical protein [Cronobacter sakazakii]EGT4294948.1 hypothetical protein [Cronobacter sakazakii]ELY5920481.1 hypothetical protein [Cronobacter sakazakii]EME1699627.1 hypothetical protein [Cronobacter sakazakii]EME1722776.1 hypothetical protein [Cronobacter sakazakii]
MINPSYDDFAWADTAPTKKTSPVRLKGGKIENQDGSVMFVAEAVTIEIEEELMTDKSYGHELLHALKISWPLLVIIIGAVFGFFQLTQSRIDTQMAEIRAQMAADRKSASDDSAALRGDMTQGFNRVADKLDDINKNLTNIQIEQASQKAKDEVSKK